MAKWIFRTGLLAAFMGMFAASTIFAADANEPERKPIPIVSMMKGTVNAVRDANGVLTAVKLTTEDKVAHNLVLNEDAKDLARLDGKMVAAQIMKQVNGELKVVSFKSADKAAAQKSATKQAPKPAVKPKSKPAGKKTN